MPRCLVVLATVFVVALLPGTASARTVFSPGAPGIGDPYFPLDGNGGYDVSSYRLDLRYDPSTDRLSGLATISARATQNLSRFNLDLHGLTVRSIVVDRRVANFGRSGDELTVTPLRGLHRGERFTVIVAYDGVPETLEDGSGFVHTDDGALVVGQPHVAATWFPVNDHPLDKASYEFHITVPAGREAVANGVLRDTDTRRGWTTWTWEAREPMASYLATATNGDFRLTSYRRDGIRFIDAVDPDLYDPSPPRTGSRYALSQKANSAFKRFGRTISVPASGGKLTFWVRRDTERNWDYFFVEAHPVGSDDWTTLADENGHTSDDTGFTCFYSDFMLHYQTRTADDTCEPTGTTGTWNAVSGTSDGYEQWSVDLAPYAGQQVEVALSYASDSLWQLSGVFVDDIVVPGGAGSTSFEEDGNAADGWHVLAPPPDISNENDWIIGGAADAPPTTGEIVDESLAREPEIVRFLEERFGRYPFSASGAIVDDAEGLGFALENQTRPIYAKEFFNSAESGAAVIVHELAHQWYGDDVAVSRWQYIWLNEGFASYAEWMWSEEEGNGTAQEIFDSIAAIPADDPFWSVVIGDPGPENLFDGAVYDRGAATLHALRVKIGDRRFFTLLRTWARTKSRGNGSIPEFIRLAERISRQQLDGFFDEWLFTGAKPASLGSGDVAARRAPSAGAPSARSAGELLHARR
jgi:hypothetical protein